MDKIQRVIKKQGHLILASLVLLIYLSPNIFFQENARVLIHDNLNSNVVWFKNIVESPTLFDANNTKVERTMNGIERGLYISEYRIIVWLYYLFPPETAYHLNIILQHLIGFLGMFLLLKTYLFKSKNAKYVITLIALSFALLPFWPSGGISISGLPLLFYSLLKVYYRTSNWKNWLYFILYPLYSELFLSGLFVVSFFTVYFIYKMIKDRRINILVFLSFFIITIIYIGTNYRLFQLILFNGFQTGRTLVEFSSEGSLLNYKGIIGLAFLEAIRGQEHFHTMSFPLLTLFILASFIFLKETRKTIIIGFGIIFLLDLGDVIFTWDKLSHLVTKSSLLTSVRFRWKSLTPFIWYLLYSKVVYFWFLRKKGKILISILTLNLIFVMFSIGDGFRYGNEYAENSFYRTYFDATNEENTTFNDFYMINLFKELKQTLPENTKVACLGILPEVAQYNNYNTFGGYYVLWSTEYEQLFAKALGEEGLGFHFNRKFYIQSKELSSMMKESKTNVNDVIIHNLRLNFDLLKQQNVSYLLSSNLIKMNNLTLVKHIKSEKGENIYVYKF